MFIRLRANYTSVNKQFLGVFSFHRTVHHILFAGVTGFALFLGTRYVPGGDPIFLLAIVFGYLGLFLILVTLMVGPVNLLLNKLQRNPVNLMLRRDTGIWAGVVSLLHVILAIQLRFGGELIYYFVRPTDAGGLALRLDPFGFSNFTGGIGLIIILLLLATSNQYALKKLKGTRWKALQRWNYAAVLLVIAHTAGYQTIALREQYFITVTLIFVLFTLVIQIAGIRQTRKQDKKAS